MLDSILITDDEMEALPPGISGFLAFEKLCQMRLSRIEEAQGDHGDTLDARISYLMNVLSAADYFDVPELSGLDFDPGTDFNYESSRYVARKIQRQITKLRFIALKERKPDVVLDEPKRAKIDHLIAQLRLRVDESDLDDRKKDRIRKKIDDLSRLFSKGGKASLQATMVTIASIFTAINQAEAAIIKLPEVVAVVLEAFGHAQEDAEQKLLQGKVQKLIEDHSGGSGDDLDDDAPY